MYKYLCLINCLAWAACGSGIQTWDASHDFNLASNPAGPWTYGWQDASSQHFTPYNTSGKTPEGLDCWWADHWTTVGGVIANTRSKVFQASGFRFPPHWLAMHPGPQKQRAALRWTAPLSGALWVEAHFAGLHGSTTTDVHIHHNGTELFAGTIRALSELAHQTLLKVRKNDTIEIMVGNGGDSYVCDYTGAHVSLSSVPGEGIGFLVGTVRSIQGLVTNCQVSARINNNTLTTTTDQQGRYRLTLPAGTQRVRFQAGQFAPSEREVTLADGAEKTYSVRLDRGVDFSYAAACPHRMTASWPGASDKSILDAFPDHLRISWTYHNMTEVPIAAAPIPHADHFIEIRPSLDGRPFANHRWTRPDGGVPIFEDYYTSEDASVRFEYIGGRETMITRVTATSSANAPRVVVVRCSGRGAEEAFRWFDPNTPGDTLMGSGKDGTPQVSLLVSGAPNHLREQKAVSLLWHLQPGESRTGWLLRPYHLEADSLSPWRQRNWETAFNEAKTKWSALLSQAMKLQLPDMGVAQGLYAAMGDLLTMQEPASNGVLTQTTGSEVYRFSNAGDCAAGVVALAQGGFLDNAMVAFQNQFMVAQPDGNWSGGAFPDFIGFSGFKAWVAMEFFHLNHDRAFLEKIYPRMLAGSRYHEKRRSQSRREDNGKPIRGYGLIQPAMQDCGMIDKTGKGVFIPHNIWAVYADKIALETAHRLGRPAAEAAEIADIYKRAFKELMACIESGAIEEPGYRWIPGSPNDPSGSLWGTLNLVCPGELVPLDHPLINGTMQKLVSLIGMGGLAKHTGYMPQGMWIAVNADNMGMTQLFRGELDQFCSLLYAALNHLTPLCTSSEERGEAPGTTSIGGDLQDIWAQAAIARAIRYSLVMERGQTLMIARAIPREWLASGKPIKVKNAPSHFGKVAYQMGYDASSGKITGELDVPKEYPPEEVRVYLRLPSDWSVQTLDPGSSATLDQEAPVVSTGDTSPVLIWKKAAGTLNFSVSVKKGEGDSAR